MTVKRTSKHIKLTSHPGSGGPRPVPINWGAAEPTTRGPVIATLTSPEHRNVIGTHSGSYAVYRALAVAARALDPAHIPDLTNTSPTDHFGPHPQWGDPEKIVSIDPWGAVVSDVFRTFYEQGYDIRPTIAITKAHIDMPEIRDAVEAGRLSSDSVILRDAGDVCVTKAAIEPVWYLPGVARRFDCTESELRRTLFEQTGGMFPELVTRGDLDVFLPPIGGQTVYIFGDPAKLGDPSVPLTARVHDECNGSDVFGSDICTCRPYLAHAIEECIRGAQAGGVGVIVYFRKEGRALGEVTKFLVYNARKRQAGGDRADQYFARTECVAGVQDMRFQELMPDVLHWLGVRKIHRLVSMSNMKHDALVRNGIEVGERVRIPDALIPADARVEMDAKMAAGYFTDGLVPNAEELAIQKGRGLELITPPEGTDGSAALLAYLRSPLAIRARCENVLEAGLKGVLSHFAVDLDALPRVADRVAAVTRANYPTLVIPVHGRLNHLRAVGIDFERDLATIGDDDERRRSLFEHVMVSVLLDAGAGPSWRYLLPAGGALHGSEGLAYAVNGGFVAGAFSSGSGTAGAAPGGATAAQPLRVDAAGLEALTVPRLAAIFQSSDDNPLAGLTGRLELLHRLAAALRARPDLFPGARPGGLVDVLRARGVVSATDLLRMLLDGLSTIWPGRLNLGGANLGDTWRHPHAGGSGSSQHLVPFHKLSQWLAYSLFEPLDRAGVRVKEPGALTGLGEYRNGGLFVDLGALVPRHDAVLAAIHRPGDEVIVEWRALTVALLDRVADLIRARLGKTADELPLACILEGGTWAAGRAVAAELRAGGGPPIRIESDGTVF